MPNEELSRLSQRADSMLVLSFFSTALLPFVFTVIFDGDPCMVHRLFHSCACMQKIVTDFISTLLIHFAQSLIHGKWVLMMQLFDLAFASLE